MFSLDDLPQVLRARVPAGSVLTFPPQGMTSDVAFAGDTLVVKRCRDPRYLDWLAHEHRALRALEHSDLPAPRLVDYADVETVSGRERWLVMKRLPGRSLRGELLEGSP